MFGGVEKVVFAAVQHTLALQSSVGGLTLVTSARTLTLLTVIITFYRRERETERQREMLTFTLLQSAYNKHKSIKTGPVEWKKDTWSDEPCLFFYITWRARDGCGIYLGQWWD